MKFQIISALMLAGLGGIVPAQAQTTISMPSPAPAASAAVAPGYQIAPGDVLGVSVVNPPSGFVIPPQVMVAPDGAVSLPLINTVALSGQTVEQATALLTKKWKVYLVNPVVTVSLVQKHLQTIVFSGAVNKPGTLDYRPNMRLLEALAEAGGLIMTGGVTTSGMQITMADAAHAVITHADGTQQALDLSHPETKNGSAVDMELVPGDVVYVPDQLGKVSVVGQVRQPAAIPWKENLTILEAISECGGIVDLDTADLRGAKLTHNGQDTPLNLEPMMRQGDMSANIKLAPGDRVFVPEFINRSYVYGDVAKPGFFLYKPGDRLLDAFNNAGPMPDADLSKVNVIHMDKVKKTAVMVRVNLNEFLLHGNIQGNPEIGPGDALYVPAKGHKTTISDILSPLYPLSILRRL